MSSSFDKIPRVEANELGEGNIAGWQDFVAMRPRRFDAAETIFERGYIAGYRMAARGKRPTMMRLLELLK
jgi:hypothetical protein